jgi:predicted RNase H-like nuclease
MAACEEPGGPVLRLYASLAALLAEQEGEALIDIPLGLPGPAPRACDALARRLLAPGRGSSVFAVPCREAVYAADYQEACAVNRRVQGRALSVQSWNICPKIREADAWLRARPSGGRRLRECHPELAFWALNGGACIAAPKKNAAGQQQRLRLLGQALPGAEEAFAQARLPRSLAAPDDLLDALALLALARLPGPLLSLPPLPEQDAEGLPMEIVYKHSPAPCG